MQLRVRVLAVLSTSILVAFGAAQAQTPGSGTVTINGSEQGPIYPCGNTSCPTYDSGQITITVNGFNASTKYSHAGGQKTSQQLANSLAAKLNTVTSPVTAVAASMKITLTSKLAGTLSNYPLSTLVTHSSLFTHASFGRYPVWAKSHRRKRRFGSCGNGNQAEIQQHESLLLLERSRRESLLLLSLLQRL
ncbi:MAG: hypothetical protein DMF15_08750 [Verrucomicrobia bacterium]|nr:MAG: hypothetical protein DMF15_08750 [Verrucomicrobiota bacterium]